MSSGAIINALGGLLLVLATSAMALPSLEQRLQAIEDGMVSERSVIDAELAAISQQLDADSPLRWRLQRWLASCRPPSTFASVMASLSAIRVTISERWRSSARRCLRLKPWLSHGWRLMPAPCAVTI